MCCSCINNKHNLIYCMQQLIIASVSDNSWLKQKNILSFHNFISIVPIECICILYTETTCRTRMGHVHMSYFICISILPTDWIVYFQNDVVVSDASIYLTSNLFFWFMFMPYWRLKFVFCFFCREILLMFFNKETKDIYWETELNEVRHRNNRYLLYDSIYISDPGWPNEW